MYLSILKETEKKMFLHLAYALSSADGNMADEEKTMIDHYCEEMGIEKSTPTIVDKSKIVNELDMVTELQSKKIIIFELIGLAIADNSYDEAEKQFISKAVSQFGLSQEFMDSCEAIISEYLSFQNKINNLILG